MKTHANCRTARSAHASVERSRNEHQSSKFSWAGIYRRALWLALAASIVWTGASLVPPGEQTVDAQGITPVAAAAADAPSYHYTTKPIEQIKEGDYVLARNPATGEIEKKRVEATFIRTCDHIRVLDFQAANGDIQRHETTDEHPYYLPQLDTFVNAVDLRTGDQVTGPNGERQYLIASTRRDEPDGITVHNFSVKDHHVYFVAGRDSGTIPVLVHNANKKKYGGRKGGKATRDHHQKIIDREVANGWAHAGGHSRSEIYYRPPGGGRKGGRYSDLEFELLDENGKAVRRRVYQTVDTDVDGLPTDREIEAAIDISERMGGDGVPTELILVPKDHDSFIQWLYYYDQ